MPTQYECRAITYLEIDLDRTKLLLEHQGLLLVELGWLRARTLVLLLEQERRLRPRAQSLFTRIWRRIGVLLELTYLFPLTLVSSKLVELHCIYVNHCHHAEWERLGNGRYRFALQ